MSTAWTRIARMLGMALPTSVAVLAMASGAAWAQSTVWNIEGSDTLSAVIKEAITLSTARLKYGNPGSGQAEHDFLNDSSAHYLEGIGPMSRNFTYSVLQAHPTWQPTSPTQVLCLDGGIMISKKKPVKSLVVTPPITSPVPTAVQISDLAIALGGYPKSCWGSDPSACNVLLGSILNPPVANQNMSGGTTAECAHPQRIKSLDVIKSTFGVNRIDHIFRRDDKSGTQDTFREWLQFTNWCNGKSEGNTNAVGSNMNNEDLDPIRRPCAGPSDWTLQDPNSPYDPNTNPYVSGTKQLTKCTYYPLARTCKANDPDIGPGTVGGDYTAPDPNDQSKTKTNPYGVIRCSQGVVVAISESDAFDNSVDITQSIGQRVAGDGFGYSLGLAGLASNVTGTNYGKINGIAPSWDNIHKQTYLLSRRLFLQRATDVQDTIVATVTGGDDRVAQENVLFNWATDQNNIAPLCVKYGFVTTKQGGTPTNPTKNAHDACTLTSQKGNVGGCGNADPGAGTPKQCIGAEGEPATSATNAYPCVADSSTPKGTYCPLIPAQTVGYECNVANASVSGPDVTDYPPNGAEGAGAEPSQKCYDSVNSKALRCNIDNTLLSGICCDPTLTPPAAGACPLPLLP